MRVLRIVAALCLTLLLSYFSYRNSEGRPEEIVHEDKGLRFEHTTVPKGPEASLVKIPLVVKGVLERGDRVLYRSTRLGQGSDLPLHRYTSVPMTPDDSVSDLYAVETMTGNRGQRNYYYFEIRDATGGLKARLLNSNDRPFLLRHIGQVPVLWLGGHIILMFATVFAVLMAALHAFALIAGRQNVRPMAVWFLWAVVFAFLGGGPFGWAMNYYAFGTIWEGVPFGTDATDNKTQLLFVYLLFMALASMGSISREGRRVNLTSPRTFGWFGAGALILMLLIYSIPHSIQFGPGLTKAVCYSFIGVVTVSYLSALIARRRRPSRRAPSKGR